MLQHQNESAEKLQGTDAYDWRIGMDPDALPWPLSVDMRTMLLVDLTVTQPCLKGDNPDAVALMLSHICWRHNGYSGRVMTALLTGLDAADFSNVHNFFIVSWS